MTWVYLTLTVACIGALAFAGMSWFDAINHAMTAVSTGGFSTRDASIAGWENPLIEWVLVVFMMLGGMPFVRFISLVQKEIHAVLGQLANLLVCRLSRRGVGRDCPCG